jgi:hypothetical protein
VKIHIGDRTYQSVSPDRAELIHLMELKHQTRHIHPGGFGMKAIKELGARVEAARKAGEEPDEDEAMLFTGMMVFFARRAAGEGVSFSDACAFPLGELRIETEPHEKADAEELAKELAKDLETTPDPTPAAGGDSNASGDVVQWRRPAKKKAPAKTAPAKTAPAKPRKRAASR